MASSEHAKIIRTTKETVIDVEVDFEKKDMNISTGLQFPRPYERVACLVGMHKV